MKLQTSGLIDIPDGLAQYQPEFRHSLVDLNHINADRLQGTLMTRTVLLALKPSCKGRHGELPHLFQLLAELTQQNDSLSMIRTVLQYICAVDNDTDLTDYINQVEAINVPGLEEELMTIAEQLKKEGRQEGMQQGMQQEAAQTLLKILSKRFGVSK